MIENDSVETIDFTGLELGNEITKEICQKLKDCKKIRNLRLMKNQLNDEVLPSLLTLPNI